MSLDANVPSSYRRRHDRGWEYGVYFVLILLISVPTALVRSFLPDPTGTRRSFLVEAWAMARRVTPQIFAV